MPAHYWSGRVSKRSLRHGCPAILLMLIIMTIFSKSLVDSPGSPAHSALIVGAGPDAAVAALSPDTIRGANPPGEPVAWPASKILREVGKQTVDQAGHFLIGAAPIWASRHLVGVPWYGWVIAPLLAYREWLQWPSNRWWDPPLDWAFLSLGAVVATCRRRPIHRWLAGRPSLRRRITGQSSSALAR